MGGYQTQPFLMYPSEWPLDNEDIVGAAAVYHQLKDWLDFVKQNGSASPDASEAVLEASGDVAGAASETSAESAPEARQM